MNNHLLYTTASRFLQIHSTPTSFSTFQLFRSSSSSARSLPFHTIPRSFGVTSDANSTMSTTTTRRNGRHMSLSFSTATAQFKNEDTIIRAILNQTQTIAMVGASNQPDRASYQVLAFLLQRGYLVFPINPRLAGQEILGQTVYGSLSELVEEAKNHPPDLVDIFRKSEDAGAVVDEAIAIQAKAVWMQKGVIDEEAAKRAQQAGLLVVMNTCPKIEMPRLGISGPATAE